MQQPTPAQQEAVLEYQRQQKAMTEEKKTLELASQVRPGVAACGPE